MDSVLNAVFYSTVQELYFDYGCTAAWEVQMRLLSLNPILYLRDYRWAPEDVVKRKADDGLCPAVSFIRESREGHTEYGTEILPPAPCRLCTGIGTYQTETDGELYLCVILRRASGMVLAYSFGVYRSAELVGKALENFFRLYEAHSGITLLSSRNPLYQTKQYSELLAKFPLDPLMTQKGSRGQAADVSTFYSQLMRKKGRIPFHTWQDGIDWLTMYLLKHNLSCSDQPLDGRNA